MTDPSLLIIGGGPAGLMAARTAARAGLRVLLFEALACAGDLGHPCSGAITPCRALWTVFAAPTACTFPPST